jgi:hypothetical protein
MSTIVLLISSFAIVIVILAFVNYRLALALYISYQILVPYLNINIGVASLTFATINLLLLFLFIFMFIQMKIPIDFTIIKPYLIFMLLLLFFIPLQGQTPIFYQFHAWRSNLMANAILPLILWNMILFDQKFLKYLTYSLMISILISCVYGLVLTRLNGINPYMVAILPLEGKEFDTDASVERASLRNITYVQSTFGHPMAFGIFLLIAFIYIFIKLKESPNLMYWIIMITISLNIVFAGVRSTFMGFLVGILYYLFSIRKFKVTIVILVVFSIFFIFVNRTEEVSKYFSFETLFESSNNSFYGSSINLRLEQLNGVLEEFYNNFFIGKGYYWHGYYLEKHGIHPVMLAFESLLFAILLDNGIVGIFIWIYFVFSMIKLNNKIVHQKSNSVLINSLLILYLAYTMFTGDYGYMRFYLIFHAIILATIIKTQNNGFKKGKSNSNLFTTISPFGRK